IVCVRVMSATVSSAARRGPRLRRPSRSSAACCRPFLMIGHRLTDAPQEEVGAAVAEESELPLEIGSRGVVVAVRAEVTAKAAELAVELEDRLRVVDGSLELSAVADHSRVGHQRVDVSRVQLGKFPRIKAGERLTDSLPLGFDDSPADPSGEDGAGDRLEIAGELAWAPRSVLPWHELLPYAGCCSNIAANGRASKNASTVAIFPSRTVYHSATRESGTGTVCRS